jgi:hypothetical protein
VSNDTGFSGARENAVYEQWSFFGPTKNGPNLSKPVSAITYLSPVVDQQFPATD